MESESNTQTQSQSGVFGGLSQVKRRPTATELRQIQKQIKRESSFDTDPYLNQPMSFNAFSTSMPPGEDLFQGEHNTSSNRDLPKSGPSHLFQAPFPMEENGFREVHATSSNSNSNSMLNFFSNLHDEFPNKRALTMKIKKEERANDTYKWTSDDLSLKTGISLFSARPFEDIFDTGSQIKMPSFSNTDTALPSQYKFVRQAHMTGSGISDYLNALRSVYSLYKRDATKKFYLLMRGVTCLFVHKSDKSAKEGFASMVLIACERKSFQQVLTKNEIDFEYHGTKKSNEESDILEKLPVFESQTAFTNKSFDFVDNVDIYIIRKKQVQSFFNVMLNETESESQLDIISEYPFANSGIFQPRLTYNGPIRLNEMSDVGAQEDLLEESPEQQVLKNFKIFKEERSLKVLYKLQIEGCILPLTLKALIEMIEKRQALLKIVAATHFITEKFDGKLLNGEQAAN